MKFLIVIAVVSCFVIVKAEENPKIKAVVEQCKKEKPIKDDELAKLFSPAQDLSNDAKCFRVCIFEKQGLIDAQGHTIKAKIPDIAAIFNVAADKVPILQEAVTKCDNKQGDIGDKCAYVDQVSMCICKELQAKGLKAP